MRDYDKMEIGLKGGYTAQDETVTGEFHGIVAETETTVTELLGQDKTTDVKADYGWDTKTLGAGHFMGCNEKKHGVWKSITITGKAHLYGEITGVTDVVSPS